MNYSGDRWMNIWEVLHEGRPKIYHDNQERDANLTLEYLIVSIWRNLGQPLSTNSKKGRRIRTVFGGMKAEFTLHRCYGRVLFWNFIVNLFLGIGERSSFCCVRSNTPDSKACQALLCFSVVLPRQVMSDIHRGGQIFLNNFVYEGI